MHGYEDAGKQKYNAYYHWPTLCFGFVLFRFLWRRSASLCLLLPAPKAAAIMALLCALFYAALAGFALPTQRALIMLCVVFVSMLSNRQVSTVTVLERTLLVIILFDPISVLSSSFWLSFFAVALILYINTSQRKQFSTWRSLIRVQLYISLGMIPILVFYFQQIAWLSPFANILAVPWVSFFVVPFVLLGSFLLVIGIDAGIYLLILSEKSISVLWEILVWFDETSIVSDTLTMPSRLLLSVSLVGLLLLTTSTRFPARWFGVFFFLLLLFPNQKSLERGQLRLTTLDVGQGLAVVIQTSKHVVLFDTGPRFSKNFDAGADIILPYLQHMGLDEIDELLVSHGDNDHRGGAQSLLKNIEIGRILTSAPEKLKGIHSLHCEKGQRWQYDGVKFSVLHPSTEQNGSRLDLSGNNQSCVLLVESGPHRILLTGDIEAEAEQLLVSNYGKQLKADILLAPHHGSKTSSTEGFIEAVSPNYVIFSAGWRNRYHFPNSTVLKRYIQQDSKIYDTATHGAISFVLDNKLAISEPVTWRQASRRYWHRQ